MSLRTPRENNPNRTSNAGVARLLVPTQNDVYGVDGYRIIARAGVTVDGQRPRAAFRRCCERFVDRTTQLPPTDPPQVPLHPDVGWAGHGAPMSRPRQRRGGQPTEKGDGAYATRELSRPFHKYANVFLLYSAAEYGTVPHPVLWTHIYATRHDVVRTSRALRSASDIRASRGASSGCTARRTRRRRRACRRGSERPARRSLAP